MESQKFTSFELCVGWRFSTLAIPLSHLEMLFKILIPGPHFRPTESESLGEGSTPWEVCKALRWFQGAARAESELQTLENILNSPQRSDVFNLSTSKSDFKPTTIYYWNNPLFLCSDKQSAPVEQFYLLSLPRHPHLHPLSPGEVHPSYTGFFQPQIPPPLTKLEICFFAFYNQRVFLRYLKIMNIHQMRK